MKLISIAGACPNFMKLASITDAVSSYNTTGASSSGAIVHKIVHTDQHYDEQMPREIVE